jgi:hypothetical protein
MLVVLQLLTWHFVVFVYHKLILQQPIAHKTCMRLIVESCCELKSKESMFHLQKMWEVTQNYGHLLVCSLSGFVILCCGLLNNTNRRLQFINSL